MAELIEFTMYALMKSTGIAFLMIFLVGGMAFALSGDMKGVIIMCILGILSVPMIAISNNYFEKEARK